MVLQVQELSILITPASTVARDCCKAVHLAWPSAGHWTASPQRPAHSCPHRDVRTAERELYTREEP